MLVERCRGVPVYTTPFQGTEKFFLDRGFHVPESVDVGSIDAQRDINLLLHWANTRSCAASIANDGARNICKRM